MKKFKEAKVNWISSIIHQIEEIGNGYANITVFEEDKDSFIRMLEEQPDSVEVESVSDSYKMNITHFTEKEDLFCDTCGCLKRTNKLMTVPLCTCPTSTEQPKPVKKMSAEEWIKENLPYSSYKVGEDGNFEFTREELIDLINDIIGQYANSTNEDNKPVKKMSAEEFKHKALKKIDMAINNQHGDRAKKELSELIDQYKNQ